jgi:hypothetical protein
LEEIAKLIRGANVDNKDEIHLMKNGKIDDSKMNSCGLSQT